MMWTGWPQKNRAHRVRMQAGWVGQGLDRAGVACWRWPVEPAPRCCSASRSRDAVRQARVRQAGEHQRAGLPVDAAGGSGVAQCAHCGRVVAAGVSSPGFVTSSLGAAVGV